MPLLRKSRSSFTLVGVACALVPHLHCKHFLSFHQNVRRRRFHRGVRLPHPQLPLLKQANTHTHTDDAFLVWCRRRRHGLLQPHLESNISPSEQHTGSAAAAAGASAPPSGHRLTFAATVLLLSSASLPLWLSPRPSVAQTVKLRIRSGS